MDVGCPRCQTEYELDDARVPEDGVTVKCTSCGHVFRVKKKSLVVTLPVREGDAAAQQARPAGDLPPAPPSREWKIRQPGGNVFACRELTTLQKWIIEGKVGRDDEISLTGDTWKRLGNIPELASFFQVFEEAKQARALQTLGNNTPLPSVPSVPPPTPSAPRITDTWREPNFTSPPQPEPVLPPAQPNIRETMREPQFSVPPPPPPVTAPPAQPPPAMPPPMQQPLVMKQPLPMAPANFRGPSDEELEKAVKGGGRGKWVFLVIVGLALGGGAGWYFGIYVPEQQRLEAERYKPPQPETPTTVTVPTPEPVAMDAGVELADAGEAVDAGVVTPPVEVDAGAPEVDAGAPEVDAGAPPVPKPEPKKSYDYFMTQGDRLREREKPEAALDMYGEAHDLKPTRAEPLAGRGLALLDMGNHLAAAAAFEDALKYNANYGPAIMGMAESLRLQGKNDRAIEYYQRYLDVLPNGVDAAVARNNIERLKK